MCSYNIVTILGPTAVGKTKLASELAYQFNGEIISADSRQVYKRMDIGTGKDLEDYIVAGKTVPYHLIDVFDPKEEFNLFEFNKLFNKSFEKITSVGKLPFLVGGTGLFLHSILSQYKLKDAGIYKKDKSQFDDYSDDELIKRLKNTNAKLHNTTDLNDRERIIKALLISESNGNVLRKPEINSLTIGIKLPREEIKSRITSRLKGRLESGMIEEVRALLEYAGFEKLNFFGLEYRYIGLYLIGELNYNDMFQKLNSSIHKFAKKQMTWFRKMEREGININWIEGPDFNSASELIERNITDL
ncbi:MAG: tRNA (adenosine(37)-N6)-dimethylallyltransferase MiaA [Melioribacteraceae bacterium]|nr:tRNA (adenosine(37)-N6)-dimethylallyltransferase MiaA [Melioribacteraceae bacterium]MCF8355549.1 tRNA (adenosine(37)-N6)-dimethylallyltransferase MiaA [Melioribacteraceae bacterium]MCF8394224.1 tRNA (adenosine(37)-N6)-dimethylallyltransferase MiaA [Melioribacteraceae bacterium]MCF8419944.1 tRNA (adenosine(37)-N6)-dimethylallyltransferase MiaA [Melioribacteraceae bacterium]